MNKKQTIFVDEYLKCWNASEAARKAGYSKKTAGAIGHELLKKPEISDEIQAKLKESHMSADEALDLLSEQARGDLGVFFKLIEEWTYYPLPSYEILGYKDVVDDSDKDNPKERTSYWVRHVVLDMERVVDPQYSHLLKRFTDSPKNGLGIEIHDKQSAIDKILHIHGKFVDKHDITTNGDKITVTIKGVYDE